MRARSALVSGLALLLLGARRDDAPPPAAGRCAGTAPTAAGSCADCHAPIATEWAASAHAKAFTEPRWRAALARLAQPERCHGCHAPEPVQNRLGRPPATRRENQDAGVDCAACHEHRGALTGPFGSSAEGHSADANPLFRGAESVHLCAACHDTRIGPVLPLVRDWRASRAAARGETCVRCPMPREERSVAFDPVGGAATGPLREGRSHALLGPSDPDFAASAFDVGIAKRGARLELSITNLAGHRVPGLVGRSFEFELVQRDAGARELGRGLTAISAENPLFVDETRRFRFAAETGVRSAVLTLSHVFAGSRSVVARREFSW